MPSILQYQQRTDVQGAGLGPAPNAAPSNGVGEGLTALAGGAQSVVQAFDTIKERDATSWSLQTLSQTQSDVMTSLDQRKQTAASGAPDFTKDLLTDFDKKANENIANAPTPASKKFMQERMVALRGQVTREAMGFEAASRVANNIDIAQQSVDSARNEVQNSPQHFAERLAERRLLIERMNLPPKEKEKLQIYAQKELAHDAVLGLIDQNPRQVLKQLDARGPTGVTAIDALHADDRIALKTQAEQAIRGQEIDALRAEALQRKHLEEQQKATQQVLLSKFVDGSITTKDVLASNLDAFGSGSKEQFIQMMKPGEKKTDPATFNDLFSRIHAADGDPNKIVDANVLNQYVPLGKLSMEDLGKLRGEVENRGTQDGENESQLKKGIFEVAKSTLTASNPLIGVRDPAGDTQLQRFTSWFQQAYDQGRKAGKTPHDLLSPDSKDYLGKQVQMYARTPQQIMNDLLNGMKAAPAPSAEPRKEGESPDDYLKRIGAK